MCWCGPRPDGVQCGEMYFEMLLVGCRAFCVQGDVVRVVQLNGTQAVLTTPGLSKVLNQQLPRPPGESKRNCRATKSQILGDFISAEGHCYVQLFWFQRLALRPFRIAVEVC